MTKGEYPYPPDEFDAVDPSQGPRGVHRRPRSRWATVWPYLAALAASAVLAYVVIGVLWDDRGTAPTTQPSEPVVEQETEPVPTVEPPVVETPTAPPDQTAPITVFNATSVAGLAGRAAELLEDAGWTSVRTDDFAGTLPGSTVLFSSVELEASAAAVAAELGITVVELDESGGAADGIRVVLEDDSQDLAR